jgi:hypothetical protein
MNNPQHEQYDLMRLKAIPIADVARQLGLRVWRAGVHHKAICPWHDDHNPSLGLVTATGKNFCYCYTCGMGGSVIDLAMQTEGWSFQEACQWLSSTFGISTTTVHGYVPQPKSKPVVREEVQNYSYIPIEMVDELVTVENSLCQCLMKMFRPEAVEWTCEEYRIGRYTMWGFENCTVFPNIDRRGRVCNLKVQHYETDTESPRFGHSEKNQCYMLASIWKKNGKLSPSGCYDAKCLFGEHLLIKYPDTLVALVESPKNAVYGALAFPKMLWIATGNKTMLQRRYLEPLHGRDVIVIPDADAVEDWTEAIVGMRNLANFTVSDFCLRHAPDGQPKFDIADYIQQQ